MTVEGMDAATGMCDSLFSLVVTLGSLGGGKEKVGRKLNVQ